MAAVLLVGRIADGKAGVHKFSLSRVAMDPGLPMRYLFFMETDREVLLRRFDELGVWKQGDQRAPHKPLLVLYALGRWQNGLKDDTFRQVESDLTGLLREFGPPRQSDHPEQPFWRLQRDGVWTVHAPAGLVEKKGANIPRITELRSHDVRAEFSSELQSALASDPSLVAAIAGRVLELHFPESLHQDILNAVGLTLEMTTTRRRRDPTFRQRVLKAYEYRCAVCGFDVRLGSVSIALDAAHIQWHQAGGPDLETNGLALCVLHHKTFDLGAFTISDGVLLVSDQANGTSGFQENLMAHHGKQIRTAQHPDWRPESRHLEWHGREVFKGQARHTVISQAENRFLGQVITSREPHLKGSRKSQPTRRLASCHRFRKDG